MGTKIKNERFVCMLYLKDCKTEVKIRLSPDLKEYLQTVSKCYCMSMSEYIRYLIESDKSKQRSLNNGNKTSNINYKL